MKKLLTFLLPALLIVASAHAQNAIPLPTPINAPVITDFGNGPMKLRVVAGPAYIFTSQGGGIGSTSGSSTTLTLTGTPATAPLVGGLISGSGITSGTTVVAFNGTTVITLSAAMTVPGGTALAWGVACPATIAGVAQYIQAQPSADYWQLYTQARICAASPGGPQSALLPIAYDNSVGDITDISVSSTNLTITGSPCATGSCAIGVNMPNVVAGGSVGSAARIPVLTYDNFGRIIGAADVAALGVSPAVSIKTINYQIAPGDCWTTVQYGVGTTGLITSTLPATTAGFADGCLFYVVNGDTGRAKLLSNFPSNCFNNSINGANGLLFPGQVEAVQVVNGVFKTVSCPGRWRPTSAVVFTIDGAGSNTTGDGLTTGGVASFSSMGHCMAVVAAVLDYSPSLTQPTCGPTAGLTITETVAWATPMLGTNTLNIAGQGGAFTWKPSGSNPLALLVGNNANIQASNVNFSGNGTPCFSASGASACTLVTVHNAAVFETLAGVTCTDTGTNGVCIKSDTNTAGGALINVDNGLTASSTVGTVVEVSGGGRLLWNGTLTANALTAVQIFSAFNASVCLAGNFGTSGSFGTARQWAIFNNGILANVSGVAVPGSTPGINSGVPTLADGIIVNSGTAATRC